MSRKKLFTGLVLGGLAAAMFATQAEAVPSFARQTGLACAACHTIFPELTPFGRSFKLNGYTLTGIKQVEAKNTSAAAGLSVDQIPPLSAMLQVTATHANAQTPTSQIAFPDQLSFFFAGKISPHMGSFIQMTMAPADGPGFGIDNSDIRYANHAGAITYGIDLNNNPTVEDLWNSTPAWGYPWTGGAGISTPMVAGPLAQAVAGLGAYADWGNGLYTNVEFYKDTGAFDGPVYTANQVGIDGLAPYWRVAYHTTLSDGNSLMVGAYGMTAKLVDSTTYSGPANKYTDTAVDTQYEHNFANSNDMLSVHASYTHEKEDLALSALGSTTMKSLRLDGTYHWGYHAEATLAYAKNKGGSGAYDDKAWTAQLSYLPWQNTKFTLQYTKYSELGGVTGSAATDNNTTLVQGWFMW